LWLLRYFWDVFHSSGKLIYVNSVLFYYFIVILLFFSLLTSRPASWAPTWPCPCPTASSTLAPGKGSGCANTGIEPDREKFLLQWTGPWGTPKGLHYRQIPRSRRPAANTEPPSTLHRPDPRPARPRARAAKEGGVAVGAGQTAKRNRTLPDQKRNEIKVLRNLTIENYSKRKEVF